MGICDGRVVIVTGAGRGIGREHALAFAAEGARVVVNDLGAGLDGSDVGESPAEQVVAEIRAAGGEAVVNGNDISSWEGARELVQQAIETFGGLDVLVNNAAISEAVPFVLLDDDDWDDLMALNVTAVFRLCRAAARAMVRQKYGRIVNIGSIAGARSIASPVHYATSKGALEGMTRSLAHELGRYGILTNCVAAGIFEGGLRSTIPEHHQKRYVDACALGRIGSPAECGELVAWLGSARNTYLNGVVLVLDGGTLA